MMKDMVDRVTHIRSLVTGLILTLLVTGVGFSALNCRAAADVVLPPRKEEQLGDEVERELLSDPEVKLYEGKKVNDYVKRLGRQAVEAAGDDKADAIKFEFKVIDDPETVNAFAMPGGQIFFYTGLLKLAETEAEVMSVMSHEVAHVTKRHIAQKLVASYGLNALTAAALGDNPGLISKLAAAIAQQGALLTFTRKQEAQADEVGIKYMIAADYDPNGFVGFFEKLKAQSSIRLPTILSSHPLPEDRIDSANEEIGGREFKDATVGRSTHQEILEALESGGTGGGDGSDGGGDADAGADAGMGPDAM